MEIEWKRSGSTFITTADNVFDEGNPALVDTLRRVTGAERPRVMLVADANVVSRTDSIGPRIGQYVKSHGIDLAGSPVVVQCGEKTRFEDLFPCKRVIASAVQAKLGRNDVLLALGGGSLFDVAGFAASLVAGGVKFVKLPTTISAMVDGAYAQTSLFNFGGAKDSFGAFAPADAVVVDSLFADTVMDGVWRAGFAELLRIGFSCDARLARAVMKATGEIKARQAGLAGKFIGAALKARIGNGPIGVGLWCANRLQAMSAYKLPHGYSVAIGTAMAARYSAMRGLLDPSKAEEMVGAFRDIGALDSVEHSQHVIGHPHRVAEGVGIWRIANPGPIEWFADIGKTVTEEEVDIDLVAKAVHTFAVKRRTDAAEFAEEPVAEAAQ